MQNKVFFSPKPLTNNNMQFAISFSVMGCCWSCLFSRTLLFPSTFYCFSQFYTNDYTDIATHIILKLCSVTKIHFSIYSKLFFILSYFSSEIIKNRKKNTNWIWCMCQSLSVCTFMQMCQNVWWYNQNNIIIPC